MLDVVLLGTGGMTPLPQRHLASALLRFEGRMVLIDCGEGTQVSLKTRQGGGGNGDTAWTGWGFKEISTIILTHLHADHIAGLPGMLLTIGNSGRRDPVLLYGPRDLWRVVQGVRAIAPQLPFLLEWRELEGGEEVEVEGMELSCLAVEHSVPCLAYSIYVPRSRRFVPERARDLGVPPVLWSRLQAGETVEWEGRPVRPEEVLGEERAGTKLSYASDTRPVPGLPDFVSRSRLLICEGMYGDPADAPKAEGNHHMLFSEAAEIARAGQVDELWLTHYSPSMADPESWLEQATRIFPNTRAGHDRMATTLRYPDP